MRLMRYIILILVPAVLSVALVSNIRGDETKMEKDKYNKLTPEEERVIIYKATELPFTGEYLHNKRKGTYICKRCNAPLYRSEDKFDSGCGWPSFDDEIEGAVKRVPDPDGRRTEIICANCEAHLGHVFTGERFTEKNTRHCVNSISLKFIEDNAKDEGKGKFGKAYFAGGCFWGVEYLMQSIDGVKSVVSGYTGGKIESPTYQQVCTGTTGHYEAVEVTFDPAIIDFSRLAKVFFEIHDFSQENGQGPDIGPQYRSAVFYVDENQKKEAEKIIEQLKQKGFSVATKLIPFEKFYPAEEYHQDYYFKKGSKPYCHMRRKIFE
ncbi:MAG: bifunctional methionine sulfoxide reductase B/A protein [Candidatus Rifleibacteriota bacterium]